MYIYMYVRQEARAAKASLMKPLQQDKEGCMNNIKGLTCTADPNIGSPLLGTCCSRLVYTIRPEGVQGVCSLG